MHFYTTEVKILLIYSASVPLERQAIKRPELIIHLGKGHTRLTGAPR